MVNGIWLVGDSLVVNDWGQDSKTITDYIHVGYTGVENVKITEANVYLFPNPTTGMINVRFEGDISTIVSITAFNTMGNMVLEINDRKSIDQQIEIDLSDYQPGVYYLNIKTGDDVILKKITLTR